ncbi:flavodoxin family protein [Candidatus Bathyarchaeota archaeon]|nr:flavodoxin family protein [Candidatus Bathyarchaeota archaeon]
MESQHWAIHTDISAYAAVLGMKTVVLHGSPRKGMNSDTLVDHLLKGLTETGEHDVKHFYVNEMSIRPCQGCLSCAPPPHMCRVDDDMTEVYEAYREADLIVWATPMYWGYLTAQLKAVQDRMEALAWEGFGGKTFALIVTYRHHYQSTVGMFERICPFFKVELHTLVCQTYDPETGKDLDINSLTEKLDEAYQLGRQLSEPNL